MPQLDFHSVLVNTHAAIGLAYDSQCVALTFDNDGNCLDSYGFDSISEGMALDPFQNSCLAPSVRGQNVTRNFRASFIGTILKAQGL